MRLAVYIFFVFFLSGLFSCQGNDLYLEKTKTLDSLGGALSAFTVNLKQTDTAVLGRALARLGYYKEFIQQNVKDTLEKSEAEHLQHFLAAGNSLEAYAKNRRLLLDRCDELGGQIANLSVDVKNKTVDENLLQEYAKAETVETSRVLKAGAMQQEQFHASLQQFKNALNGVEQLIRKRNNGELPTIIKDTVAL